MMASKSSATTATTRTSLFIPYAPPTSTSSIPVQHSPPCNIHAFARRRVCSSSSHSLRMHTRASFFGSQIQLPPAPAPALHLRHGTDENSSPASISRTSMLFDVLKRLLGRGADDTPESYDINELSKQHPAIELQSLRKTFKRKIAAKSRRLSPLASSSAKASDETIVAVDDVSLSVNRGEIFALLGPNSCGKSTTMRCMATLTEPDSGSVRYFGVDAIENDFVARRMFGFVMQSNGVDKMLTGREHLHFFAGLCGMNDKVERDGVIEELIDMLQLGPHADRLAGVYSGGIIRRMDLAIALLHRPPILILDEPTVGLDVESRRVIWNTLRRWKDGGGTVFLSSHYLEEVDILADRLAIMDKGVIINQGTATDLKDSLGGDRISIRIEEFTQAHTAERVVDHLRKLDFVVDAVVNRFRGNTIELVVDQEIAPQVGSLIVNELKYIGHERLFSFAQAKPSLDDVYLAATGQKMEDADSYARTLRTEKALRKENMT